MRETLGVIADENLVVETFEAQQNNLNQGKERSLGKLFFAHTPFLNISLLLADPPSQEVLTLVEAFTPNLAKVNLNLLRGKEQRQDPPAPLKKCTEVVVEPFDDGWPEYEEAFIDVQTL